MRGVARGSLFVACIGIVNLASVMGNPVRGDVVFDWNNAALNAIRSGNTPPPVASRALAILHASIYDAVNGIARTHEPYLVQKRRSCQRVACRCCQRCSPRDPCKPVSS
jgi:hypothetical protein